MFIEEPTVTAHSSEFDTHFLVINFQKFDLYAAPLRW
jgi:hypothetical protein